MQQEYLKNTIKSFAANQKRKNTQILTCWRDIVIWQGSCRLAHRLPLCPSGFRTSFVLLGDIASKLPKNHFHGCSQPIWWWFAISFQVWGPNVFQNFWPQINPSARLDFGEFVYVRGKCQKPSNGCINVASSLLAICYWVKDCKNLNAVHWAKHAVKI